MNRRALVAGYCCVVGALDAGTGGLLVSSPQLTLRLMGVEGPSDPTLLRWIGTFVGAVGLSYLYPFLLASARRSVRWRVIFEVTCLTRLAVGLFVVTAIASGALALAWISVAITDLCLALVQAAMLRRDWEYPR